MPKLLKALTNEELKALKWDWSVWAREEQLPPPGDWQFWSYIGGRGAGKTRTGAETVRLFKSMGYRRIALVAPTHDDFDKVMVRGESGILNCCPPWDIPVYNESKKTLKWPNGTMAIGYSAEKPERLRGHQFDCFVAGTKVRTPDGEVPIEQIKVGDYVITRKGPRRVIDTKSRDAVVGKVLFSNGSSLIGTATHPIYTAHGWVEMGRLSLGDSACAINASSGAVSGGIAMKGAAPLITNAQIKALSQNALSDCIGRFGNTITALLKKVTTFITSTAMYRTTQSIILNAYPVVNTSAYTMRKPVSNAIGKKNRFVASNVPIAGRLLNEKLRDAPLSANLAGINEPKKIEKLGGVAVNAAKNLNHVPETFAVSVASTWQRVAETKVYCFTVEKDHEYFANDVLVHNCGWCDELAAWHPNRRQETWDMFLLGLRLPTPENMVLRTVVTTTPMPVDVIKQLMESAINKEAGYELTRSSTYHNRRNLSKQFFETIIKKYEGTRLGQQELMGELLLDIPGALWNMDMINPNRVDKLPMKLKKIVVAVDPSGAHDNGKTGNSARERENAASQSNNDEIGIVVAASDYNDHYYVLQDATILGGPDLWSQAAVNAFYDYDASEIIAETNFGGGMVVNTIQRQDPDVRVKPVTASRGKSVRASPIALLYEQNRVHHFGDKSKFAKLEDQLCKFTMSGYTGQKSPDRADALIWALSELSGQTSGKMTILKGRV